MRCARRILFSMVTGRLEEDEFLPGADVIVVVDSIETTFADVVLFFLGGGSDDNGVR